MIINKNDIAASRELAAGIKEKKINQYIEDAEFSDLRPLLGEEFYHAIKTTPSNYTNLLDPLTYTYGGYTYSHIGLKSVLIDFAYARLRLYGNDTSVPYGFVEKQSQYSQPTDGDRDRQAYNSIRKTAMGKWSQVESYLIRKFDEYPLWFYPDKPLDNDDDYININRVTLK